MPLVLVVGGLFGDEGKGKVSASLSALLSPSIAARTGATNAGHTVVHRGERWKLRALPAAAVTSPGSLLVIARGALVHLAVLLGEARSLGVLDRLKVDHQTGIITEEHVEREKRDRRLMEEIGSTGTGVGMAMVDRVLRRLKLARSYPELKGLLADTQQLLLDALDRGETVLAEATQGYWLSLYHGTYPYVTSRDTTAAAALSELGLGPRHATRIVVVAKAYMTRVGAGPLPGELAPEEAARRGWTEYGTVTGRPRRAAPLDTGMLRRAARANTATDLAVTKLDKLFPETRCIRSWDRLPRRARQWLEQLEEEVGVPVTIVSTGEDTECTAYRPEAWSTKS